MIVLYFSFNIHVVVREVSHVYLSAILTGSPKHGILKPQLHAHLQSPNMHRWEKFIA